MESKEAAEGRHDHKADIGNTVHNRAHRTSEDLSRDADLGQFIGGFVEFTNDVVLLAIGHDGAVSRDHFLGMAVEHTKHFRTLPIDLSHYPRHIFGNHDGQDHGEHGNQGQLPAMIEHNGNGADNG